MTTEDHTINYPKDRWGPGPWQEAQNRQDAGAGTKFKDIVEPLRAWTP